MAVVGTPSTLATIGVSAGMVTTLWNRMLRKEAVLDSVFTNLSGVAVVSAQNKVKKIPDGIFITFKKEFEGKIPRQITVAMVKPLSERPFSGDAQTALSNEENLDFRYVTFFYQEVKKPVKVPGWGVTANDYAFFDAQKQAQPLASQFIAELEDARIQEALLLRYDATLTNSPVTKVQQFNPNFFVVNRAIGDQPAYDTTALSVETSAYPQTPGSYPTFSTYSNATNAYVENIGDAMFASTNDGANPEFGNLVLEDLFAIEYWAIHDKRIRPVMLGGMAVRLAVLPSPAVAMLKNPLTTGSIGSAWKDFTSLPDRIQHIPGIIGMVGNLAIVDNLRHPTLELTGDNNTWDLRPGFMYPGNSDGRDMSTWSTTSALSQANWHVGYVLGQEAVARFEAVPLMFKRDDTEYEQFQGILAVVQDGYQRVEYDQDSPDSTSFVQNGSAIIATTAPDIMSIQSGA